MSLFVYLYFVCMCEKECMAVKFPQFCLKCVFFFAAANISAWHQTFDNGTYKTSTDQEMLVPSLSLFHHRWNKVGFAPGHEKQTYILSSFHHFSQCVSLSSSCSSSFSLFITLSANRLFVRIQLLLIKFIFIEKYGNYLYCLLFNICWISDALTSKRKPIALASVSSCRIHSILFAFLLT